MNNFFLPKDRFKNIAWLLVVAMFFIGDRILKNLALNLGEGQSLNIFGSWLKFRLAFNPYIAFSIPIGGILINLLVGLIIIILILFVIYLINNKKIDKISINLFILIITASISNFIDRIIYGAVIDYLDLEYFTILNLADIIISISCFILIFKLKTYGNNGKN